MECKEQMKVSEEKLALMEAQLSAGEERVTSLKSKLSDSNKDITWYKTQAKSFSKANEELQRKVASIEDNASSSPVREDAKVDDDVTIVDMDVVSDEEEEEVKVDDNSDDSQPSTSKQRSETSQPRNCQDDKDKRESSTRTKRSRSCSPMGESRKQKRPDRTVEEKRRQASLERSPSLVIKVQFDRLGEGVQERVEEKKLCWVRSLKSQWERNLEGGKVEEQEMKSSANKKEMVKKKGWNFGKKK